MEDKISKIIIKNLLLKKKEKKGSIKLFKALDFDENDHEQDMLKVHHLCLQATWKMYLVQQFDLDSKQESHQH